MEEKDKIIASLRHQLKEAVSRCNALEQENALLSYQLEQMAPKWADETKAGERVNDTVEADELGKSALTKI